MPVNDFQIVRKGDLIAVIDPSDYQAQLDLAGPISPPPRRRSPISPISAMVQQALVEQAQATIDATEADVLRYQLEDKRQRDLLRPGIAGTQQAVEQADDNAKRSIAQRRLERGPARAAKGRAGRHRHPGEAAQGADQGRRGSGRARFRQSGLYAHPVAGRRSGRPAAGAARPVRQCRNAGDRRRAATQHLGDRQLQGNPDDQRPARPAGPGSPSTPSLTSSSPVMSTAGRRGPEARSRCCRPTTPPAISPKSCSGFR